MRLIDADALNARLYHEAFETDTDMQKWDSGCWIRYKMFECAIDEAPTIEPKQEWIPCSERLPESQGYYICTCKDGPICRRTTTIKWSNGWQLSGRRAFWTVVAWMLLPEPWKGADDD